jgi:L-rhamnose mutarotase
MDDIFDVVIPVGPNDVSTIHKQLEYTKKNIIGRRNIYVVSNIVRNDISGVIFIPESIFPFSIKTVAEIHGTNSRNGWYLQQLLKLYAGFCIPGILPRYLVVDADTFFLNPTRFIDHGITLFNLDITGQNHTPYFQHMLRLHPSLERNHTISGICHHMLFTTEYVKELFNIVETHHKKSFWQVFLEEVDSNWRHNDRSGASEYEMYFNFMNNYHADSCTIRRLYWANVSHFQPDIQKNYDYVSAHWHGIT